MASLNRCSFIGNLGADPEIRTTQGGNKVATLSLACSEKWKDKNTGEQRERTEWIRIVIWNEGLVRVAEQYLRKGSKIFAEGQMQTRKWQDQSGADKYTTEIVIQAFGGQIIMLDGRRDDNGAGDQQRQQQQDRGGYQDRSPAQRPGSDRGGQSRPAFEPGGMDDDIPF